MKKVVLNTPILGFNGEPLKVWNNPEANLTFAGIILDKIGNGRLPAAEIEGAYSLLKKVNEANSNPDPIVLTLTDQEFALIETHAISTETVLIYGRFGDMVAEQNATA